jgi:hypothetical protein
VLGFERQRLPQPPEQIDVGQFVDDSAFKELEKEGFFKKLTGK